MKRFLTCLCLIVTSLALCSGLAGAAKKVRINLLSTPFGTGSYVLGTALENIVNKGDYPILISHAETPGQAFNVNKLNADPAARKNTVGTASKGINWLAAQGKKPFPAKRTPLLLIGSYTYTATWLVTADESIKSVSDLRGKRIAMGRIPQAIWGYEPDALLRCGYSDDFYKSLSIQYVGTGEAATALVNGRWTPPPSAATWTPSAASSLLRPRPWKWSPPGVTCTTSTGRKTPSRTPPPRTSS